MPEVVALLIPSLRLLCLVLLSFSNSSEKKWRSRGVPFSRDLNGR